MIICVGLAVPNILLNFVLIYIIVSEENPRDRQIGIRTGVRTCNGTHLKMCFQRMFMRGLRRWEKSPLVDKKGLREGSPEQKIEKSLVVSY